MLRTIERIGCFRFERIWFQKEIIKVKSDAHVLRYMRLENIEEKKRANADKAETLWTLLDKDSNELMSEMRKQVRYEIRRAEKEDIEIFYYSSKDIINKSLLDTFEKAYNHFCEISGREYVKSFFNKKRVKSYADYNGIIMSEARFEKGKIYHIYVADGNLALLHFSVSDFRNKDVDNNLAGRANKLLHYKDLLFFREHGYNVYDWGNVSSFENPNGIDNFKISFGGVPKVVYSVYIANGFIGKFLLMVKAILEKIKK